MYAGNFGAGEMSVAIDKTSSWKKVVIGGIAVSNGQCQVGIRSDANANNWVKVDDFSLVNTPATAVAAGFRHGRVRVSPDGFVQVCSTRVLSIPPGGSGNDQKHIAVYDLRGNRLRKIAVSENGSFRSIGVPDGVYVLRALAR